MSCKEEGQTHRQTQVSSAQTILEQVYTLDELHLKSCFYYKTELNIATKPRYVLGCQLLTVFTVLHFIHFIIIIIIFLQSLVSRQWEQAVIGDEHA